MYMYVYIYVYIFSYICLSPVLHVNTHLHIISWPLWPSIHISLSMCQPEVKPSSSPHPISIYICIKHMYVFTYTHIVDLFCTYILH